MFNGFDDYSLGKESQQLFNVYSVKTRERFKHHLIVLGVFCYVWQDWHFYIINGIEVTINVNRILFAFDFI